MHILFYGIKINCLKLCSKDVSLPVQMQRVMASEAEATREARAKVIAAEGEEKASKSLRAAAIILSETPVAVQLRYLQTLTDISAEHSSTIIFPVPMDMTSFGSNNRAPRQANLVRRDVDEKKDLDVERAIIDIEELDADLEKQKNVRSSLSQNEAILNSKQKSLTQTYNVGAAKPNANVNYKKLK